MRFLGGFVKGVTSKIVVLANVVVILARLLSSGIKSLAKTVGTFKVLGIPVGKPFGVLLSGVSAPFSLIGKMLPVVLVVDVILILIAMILKFAKKKKEKKAMEEAAKNAVAAQTAPLAEEVANTSASSKLMKVFKE